MFPKRKTNSNHRLVHRQQRAHGPSLKDLVIMDFHCDCTTSLSDADSLALAQPALLCPASAARNAYHPQKVFDAQGL